jgi:hypothetical protein
VLISSGFVLPEQKREAFQDSPTSGITKITFYSVSLVCHKGSYRNAYFAVVIVFKDNVFNRTCKIFDPFRTVVEVEK